MNLITLSRRKRGTRHCSAPDGVSRRHTTSRVRKYSSCSTTVALPLPARPESEVWWAPNIMDEMGSLGIERYAAQFSGDSPHPPSDSYTLDEIVRPRSELHLLWRWNAKVFPPPHTCASAPLGVELAQRWDLGKHILEGHYTLVQVVKGDDTMPGVASRVVFQDGLIQVPDIVAFGTLAAANTAHDVRRGPESLPFRDYIVRKVPPTGKCTKRRKVDESCFCFHVIHMTLGGWSCSALVPKRDSSYTFVLCHR
ncbi:hypothetical protein V8E55_011981 [Tylopilus felleus]